MKRFLLLALLALAMPASASLCLLGVVNSTCTFATDTSGGTALFTNPSNLSNIGSGTINPFLTTQVGGNGGLEFGVSTDIGDVNSLPLDTKRDNANTFTNTFQLNQLGVVTILGTDYYSFFLDINEPNGNDANFLSLDTLRIWGRTGATATDPFLASNLNVTSGGLLETLNTVFPDLQLVYALGPLNFLIMDYDLFAGSGLGYDLNFLIPTSEFAGLVPDSRIVFSTGYGGAVFAGASAQDGFEEWAYLPGTTQVVPEPATLALMGLGLAGLGFMRKRIA